MNKRKEITQMVYNRYGKTYNTTPNKPYYLDLELLVEE